MKYMDKSNELHYVDAIQWKGDNSDEIQAFVGKTVFNSEQICSAEGAIGVCISGGMEFIYLNDYIVKDMYGGIFPYDRERFEDNYTATKEKVGQNNIYFRCDYDLCEFELYICGKLMEVIHGIEPMIKMQCLLSMLGVEYEITE